MKQKVSLAHYRITAWRAAFLVAKSFDQRSKNSAVLQEPGVCSRFIFSLQAASQCILGLKHKFEFQLAKKVTVTASVGFSSRKKARFFQKKWPTGAESSPLASRGDTRRRAWLTSGSMTQMGPHRV